MSGRRRLTAVAAVAAVTVVASASPAAAHGVGGRADLPLPVWLFAYSAAFALLISFVALRILWPRPRLARLAVGRRLPEAVDYAGRVALQVVRVAMLALFALTLASAWFGIDSVAVNLAPTAFYVTFWVGMQIASAVFGDVWRTINPIATIATGFDRLARRDPMESRATGRWASHWPAVVGLSAFLWLELAYFEPGSVPAVGIFLGVYTAGLLAGGLVFGAGWIRTADGFAVLFELLGALSPLFRDDEGHLRWRVPGSGLATVVPRDGTLALILVLLGGTTFDGVSRTQVWKDVVGTSREWQLTITNTVGLALVVGTVAVLFLVASRAVSRLAGDDETHANLSWRWAASLIPIVLAYSIAHYFSLLVFEGQAFVALLSDPFGHGWDWFGTADRLIDYTVVSPNQIAYVQVAAVVIGHVVGVITAHDRAVECYDERTATRSQYPMLAVMIAYTVGALLLLLNA